MSPDQKLSPVQRRRGLVIYPVWSQRQSRRRGRKNEECRGCESSAGGSATCESLRRPTYIIFRPNSHKPVKPKHRPHPRPAFSVCPLCHPPIRLLFLATWSSWLSTTTLATSNRVPARSAPREPISARLLLSGGACNLLSQLGACHAAPRHPCQLFAIFMTRSVMKPVSPLQSTRGRCQAGVVLAVAHRSRASSRVYSAFLRLSLAPRLGWVASRFAFDSQTPRPPFCSQKARPV